MIKPTRFPSTFEVALREKVDGEVLFDKASRLLFSTDASIFMVEPKAVFIPSDSRDIAKAVKVCKEQNVTLHPRGGATGLAGESLGRVDHLIETGANDVLVLAGDRERLIPYGPDVIRQVDLETGQIEVDWDKHF